MSVRVSVRARDNDSHYVNHPLFVVAGTLLHTLHILLPNLKPLDLPGLWYILWLSGLW